MSANGSAMPQESSEIQDKGKGKSVEQAPQQPAFEDEEDEEEESGADEVRFLIHKHYHYHRTTSTNIYDDRLLKVSSHLHKQHTLEPRPRMCCGEFFSTPAPSPALRAYA